VATLTVATVRGKAGFTVGYAPAQSASATDAEAIAARAQFWECLEQHAPKGHLQLIAGDFNTTLGPEDAVTAHVGPHGRGATTCPNGLMLQTLAEGRYHLENTLRDAPWHGTWVRPDGIESAAAKDFILTNSAAHRVTISCCTLRGTGVSSDHYPVVAKLATHHARGTRTPRERKGILNRRWLRDLVPPHRPDEPPPPETSERLAVREAVRQFVVDHPPTTNVNELYARITSVSQHIYTNIMPPPARNEKPWMTTALLEFITAKNMFCDSVRAKGPSATAEERAELKSQQSRARRLCREAKDTYMSRKATELEQESRTNNSHWFHMQADRAITPSVQAPIALVIDGTRITQKEDVDEAFRAYFHKLLTIIRPTSATLPPKGRRDRNRGIPMLNEVEKAIAGLRNYKTPDLDGQVAELLKYGGPELVTMVWELLAECWRTGVIPSALDIGRMFPLHKKGPRTEVTNYRGVVVLNTLQKVLARIVLHRTRDVLEAELLDCQSGFRPDRGTVDHIWVLSELIRMCREFQIPLFLAFVDLEKAYDGVPRDLLFALLRRRGVSEDCVAMIEVMYANAQCTIDGKVTFPIVSGVRQGCLLSCLLFNVIMDAVMRDYLAKVEGSGGIGGVLCGIAAPVVRPNHLIREALYADDLGLAATTMDELSTLLTLFDAAATPWGMKLSITKTEVMVCNTNEYGPWLTPCLHGRHLPITFCFRYLGHRLNHDATLDCELGHRLACARGNWAKYRFTIFLNKDLSTRTKVRMFKVYVLSALLYAAETWVTTSDQERRLATLYHSYARQICGVKWWHFKSTEDVLAMADLPSFRLLLASRRLRWVGHLHRMDPTRLTRSFSPALLALNDILAPTRPSAPNSKRRPGGQRKTYSTCARDDLEAMAAHRPTLHPKECLGDRARWRAFINPFPEHPPTHKPPHNPPRLSDDR
jgi:hypothetical protein